MRPECERIVLAHPTRGLYRVEERILGTELCREHYHHFIANVFIDDSRTVSQCLSADPGKEMIDERESLCGIEFRGPARESSDVCEEHRSSNLATLDREKTAPAVIDLCIDCQHRRREEVLQRVIRVHRGHSKTLHLPAP